LIVIVIATRINKEVVVILTVSVDSDVSETAVHLFFNCDFSSRLWTDVRL